MGWERVLRGGVALLSPIEESAEEVRAALAPVRHDFSVAVWCAANAFAVGAIIRVAHNYLAREVILVGPEPFYEKASMGMEKYETLVRCAGEDEFFAHVGERPVWCFEKDAARTSLHAVPRFPEGVVLVFGSERFGVPKNVLARADEVVGIPIYGVNHSLPVAVAAGIAMNELARRKYAP
jgi:tRNA G18 (ribose-2'-O)-methylase SpoU